MLNNDKEGQKYAFPANFATGDRPGLSKLEVYAMQILSGMELSFTDLEERMNNKVRGAIEYATILDKQLVEIKNGESFSDVARKFMDWSLKTFVMASPESHVQKLLEEVDELSKEITSAKASNEDLKTELADCIIVLLAIAAKTNITPDEIVSAIKSKTEINFNRKWKHDKDGVYSHIKEVGYE